MILTVDNEALGNYGYYRENSRYIVFNLNILFVKVKMDHLQGYIGQRLIQKIITTNLDFLLTFFSYNVISSKC